MKISKLRVHRRCEFFVGKAKNKTVLSVGLGGFDHTTNYSFDYHTANLRETLSGRIAEAAKSATFVDISQGAIGAFSGRINGKCVFADITDRPDDWPSDLKDQKFEVILLGEVLEHLTDPGRALMNLTSVLKEGGQIVISVPSAFSLPGIAHAVFGNEEIHPEHVCYYSPATLTRLLNMCHLQTEELCLHGWQKRDYRFLYKKPLTLVMFAISMLFPQFAHGVVAVAARES